MARFFHLVGGYGTGKTTLAVALSERFEAQGIVCAGADSPEVGFIHTRAQARSCWPDAQVIFLEHLSDDTLDAGPGDVVIRIERMAPAAKAEAGHSGVPASIPSWDGVAVRQPGPLAMGSKAEAPMADILASIPAWDGVARLPALLSTVSGPTRWAWEVFAGGAA